VQLSAICWFDHFFSHFSRQTSLMARLDNLSAVSRAQDRRQGFPSFSTEDRAMVVETLITLQGTLDEVLNRAAKGGKIPA
jgi:hypothetical protein